MNLQKNCCFINFFKNSCLAYVDFKQIFGIHYIENFMNLYKYFIKSLGCGLVSGGLELSSEFPNLLGSNDLLSSTHFKNFRVTICRCDSAQVLLNIIGKKLSIKSPLISNNILGKGDLQATYSKTYFKETGLRIATSAVWWESIGHLRIWYWYNKDPIGKFGFPMSDPNNIYPIKQASLTYNEIKQYDNLLAEIILKSEKEIATID